MEKPTKRGVYYDIPNSPIIYQNNGKVYHFSSNKKKDMFIKQVIDMKQRIDKIKLQMQGMFGNEDVDNINWAKFYNRTYDIVYDRMVLK